MLLVFQLKSVWKSLSPFELSSIALKKNSMYSIFFKKQIHEMISNGQIDLYRKRHFNLNNICRKEQEIVDPLGFPKLASIFSILPFGILISVILLFYEHFKKPKKIAVANTLSEKEMEMVEKFRREVIKRRKGCMEFGNYSVIRKHISTISKIPRRIQKSIPKIE